MDLCELIKILRNATEVEEIDKYKDEIMMLIPETKIMMNCDQ